MRPILRRGHAFTLVEVLVAVGAVTLIALGLARVFSTTGDTMRIGRRVSNMNEYASLLERQLREDVAAMTREGFLVIRHRQTSNSITLTNVSLTADQLPQLARPRRVDELMFFANGRFTTLRDPIHPSRVASSNEARIYYGHGLRYRENHPNYYEPHVDDPGTSMIQSFGEPFAGNPNQYASDWILLRHVTVLTNQLATNMGPVAGFTNAQLRDNEIQVALQPAAANLFRHISPGNHPGTLVRTPSDGTRFPWFSSGLIDICTTDLNEIRQVILDAQPCITINDWDPARDNNVDGAFLYAHQHDPMPANQGPTDITSNMKRWMLSAFPASRRTGNNFDPFNTEPDLRMRAELAPTNLLGVVGSGLPWPLAQPWRRTDQMMLAASNFVPRCTEFIVEWSFGNVVRSGPQIGQLIWHGLDSTSRPGAAAPYNPVNVPDHQHRQAITLRDGMTVQRNVASELVHFAPNFGGLNASSPLLYSCFGYVDPTYAPPVPDPQFRYPSTIPWVWPRLLRITISLVDPGEPNLEQTFQFVFEIPEAKTTRY